ncbi:MAG: DedA family protein [Gammaproteobacteria bacterium]|nr:DedA family protein [Gammaproteobacteria bacterium]
MLHDLIRQYGYIGLFIGTLLEGETIMLLAGFAAQHGDLRLSGVVTAGFLGSFLGDQVFFYVGRHFGPAIVRKRLSWRANADKVFRLIDRHQSLLIVSFRFYYGLRSVTPFAIGAARVGRVRFFVLNAIGAILWSVTLGGLGFLFGRAFAAYFSSFRRYELDLLAVFAGAGICVWLTTLILRRRKAARLLRSERDRNES